MDGARFAFSADVVLGLLSAACNRGQQPPLASADGTPGVVVQDKQPRDREATDQAIDAQTVAAYEQLGATERKKKPRPAANGGNAPRKLWLLGSSPFSRYNSLR